MLTASKLMLRFPDAAGPAQIARLRTRLVQYGAAILAAVCALGLLVYATAGYSPAVYAAIAACSLANAWVAFRCRAHNGEALSRLSVGVGVALAVTLAVAGDSASALIWFVPFVLYAGSLLETTAPRLLSFVALAAGLLAGITLWISRGYALPHGSFLVWLAYSDVAFAVVGAGLLMRSYGDFTRLVTRSSIRRGADLAARVAQARTVNAALARRRLHLEELRRESRSALRAERHATQQLRASREQLEQFAYAASHDLKEPVRTVRSFMQVARRRLPASLAADAQLADYFEHVERSSGTMHALLEKLLAYSRIERRPGEPVAVDVAAALRCAAASLGEDYHADPSLSGCLVLVDRARFTLALAEIVANVVTFAADGQAPRLWASAHEGEGGSVELRLRDAGIGVEPAYREQVFGLFRRLHERERYPGPGVGLALVRRIAEEAGGAAWITGGRGGGTTVHLRLPRG